MLRRYVELLNKLSPKLYFSSADLAGLLKIGPESAKVLATRYTKSGLFIRLKRDFYCLAQNWQKYSIDQYLKIANVMQVPSYISFMTALSYYEVTTQVQHNFFESAAQKRSTSYNIEGVSFNYYKLKRSYYFGFVRKNDTFISIKEKALVDAIYLYSYGKYRIDLSSLDIAKLDSRELRKIVNLYPERTKKTVERLCKI